MKILTVTYGPRHDRQIETVELLGVYPDECLIPKMARRAARIGAGHEYAVKVTEADGNGYHICSPTHVSRNSFYKIRSKG